jgi:hypothetical protein
MTEAMEKPPAAQAWKTRSGFPLFHSSTTAILSLPTSSAREHDDGTVKRRALNLIKKPVSQNRT